MTPQTSYPLKIDDCYVSQTIGSSAVHWYASVLNPFIMEKGIPARRDVAYLCNHLERVGLGHRELVIRAGAQVPAANQITRIKQANQASNKKDVHNVWVNAGWKMVGLMDFVPEQLELRTVLRSLWTPTLPYAFPLTQDQPPLFFCHENRPTGPRLGLRLHELYIRDGKRFIAPHENAVKCALTGGQGKMPPPMAMREDFELAIWVPGCGRPNRACMRWESRLTKARPGFEYQPTIARLVKNVMQFLIEATADATKQGVPTPYLDPKYDTLLVGLMQLSAEPPNMAAYTRGLTTLIVCRNPAMYLNVHEKQTSIVFRFNRRRP